ncbi:gametocyte-specific factor 1 homolog [Zeugodacus cucurbitae]|uniref:Protein D7 n=1 Tax=Zeugodacus cucurbitae TaxID=28588 RepID=A0A0A1XHV8_ZEUCU|nr:gametocyte-specific factor 1 homolog [Zeugodacus cucurbitae]
MSTHEEYVQCPYDPAHTILKKRFQVHLGRCRKNQHNAPKVTCPFNVTHILNKQELDWHVKNCPNRASFEHYRHREEAVEPGRATTLESSSQVYQLETEENWDDLPPVPTYDPQAYASKAPVLRNLQGQPKSVKKKFRSEERRRLLNIHRNN